MEEQAFQEILKKVGNGTATASEISQYLYWYHSFKSSDDVWIEMKADPSAFKFSLLNRIKQEINSSAEQVAQPQPEIARSSPGRQIKMFRWVAAIAALVAVIVGIFLANNENQKVDRVLGVNEVAPARQGVFLSLSNGRRISLSAAADGKLVEESGIRISKTAKGELVYELSEKGDQPDQLNTLSTGKGETFKLRLPDGSMIWLNAASSLTYQPDLLEGGRRLVLLRGEAYFEIAKDAEHPFIVKSRDQEIAVLGTHFNVNSYGNEPMVSTTLLEGSLRVIAAKEQVMLSPGQQSVTSGSGLVVSQVDAESFLAWRNRQFLFEKQHIQHIMRVIERWYDVEIVYQGDPIDATFSGGISRFDHLSQVLESLESTDKVKFEIEGRVVYVRN